MRETCRGSASVEMSCLRFKKMIEVLGKIASIAISNEQRQAAEVTRLLSCELFQDTNMEKLQHV